MDAANKKKIARASHVLQEVADTLESKFPDEFEEYGQRLFALADEIEAFLEEIEDNEPDEEEEGSHDEE
jgi:ABC-type Zn uptake system ZnuABC Zn-binding protein ZnuA